MFHDKQRKKEQKKEEKKEEEKREGLQKEACSYAVQNSSKY